jgi:antitoxin (DNA-binding transcriptional repressor) of toxin-antitoxin stability system
VVYNVVTMAKINVRELKANLSAVLERVAGGETVTVFKRSEAIAELRPISGQRKPGLLDNPVAGVIVPESFFDPLPDEILAAFEGRDSS